MTSVLRRKLDALRRLAEHPTTPADEAAAAELAIGRILLRLGEPSAPDPDQDAPALEPSQRSSVRPYEDALAMGDLIDCHDREGTFRRCRCGCDRFEVTEGGNLAPALLVCVKCRRSRKLQAEHFRPGGRHRGNIAT
jgi:hypothetical protein